MRRAALLLPALLAACGDEPDRGFAATAGGARQEPYVAVPPGSVPRGTTARQALLARGGSLPPTPALIAAGRRAYVGKCAACHGLAGLGDGPVVEKGFPRPPPLGAVLRQPEAIVAIIAHGIGEMPPMAEEVPPAERWAIAHYLGRAGGGGDAG